MTVKSLNELACKTDVNSGNFPQARVPYVPKLSAIKLFLAILIRFKKPSCRLLYILACCYSFFIFYELHFYYEKRFVKRLRQVCSKIKIKVPIFDASCII